MNSDYDVRLTTLEAMGGDVTKQYNSVYDIDLEILRLTEQSGGSVNMSNWTTGINGIPTNWTVEEDDSNLGGLF